MIVRLRGWLTSRPLAAQAALAVALLAAALLWAAWPGGGPSPHADPASRPVLSSDAGAPGSTAAAGSAQENQGESVDVPAPPEATATPFLLPHQEPQPADAGLSWTTAVRTALSLAAVLALIFVCARLLHAFVSATASPSPSGRLLRVLETTYLPSPSGRGRSAISLVEFGERLLLIGATDAQLTLLAEIDPAELPDPYRGQLHRPASGEQVATLALPAAAALQEPGSTLPESAAAGGAFPAGRGRSARAALAAQPDGSFATALAALALDGQHGAPAGAIAKAGRSEDELADGVRGAATRRPRIAEASESQDELAELLRRLRESARRLEANG